MPAHQVKRETHHQEIQSCYVHMSWNNHAGGHEAMAKDIRIPVPSRYIIVTIYGYTVYYILYIPYIYAH